jgi:F-type H+-transporting ATPase subunit b
MDSVLASLGALLLRAAPTILILAFLHIYLKIMFFKPLEQALKERKAATTGLKKLADESLKKAELKAVEYEEAIRAARAALYKEQEDRRTAYRTSQAVALKEMRAKMDAMVAEARQRLAAEKESAKASLGAESEALAEQITKAVLAGGVH